MTLRVHPIALSLSLLLAAAAPAMAQEPKPAEPAQAAAAQEPAAPAPAAETKDAGAAAAKVAPPPEGKGQVVFFRPSNMLGMALSFSVHEGDKGIGKLSNGSYFVHVADPGPHLFTIQSEVTDKLTLEIDAGETYYVKQTIGVGIVAGRPRLSPAEQGDFERLKLKVSTKKPTDMKPKANKAD
jgi:Protein of unknown function (DUF2846)